VYPAAGFPFLGVELRGLSRSVTLQNLAIPMVVARAARSMSAEFQRRRVGAVLGLGGYVTIPAALAAWRVGARLAVSEQNAEAGLANAVAGRVAHRTFGSFPQTRRLPAAEWVGNPVRRDLARFDRQRLMPEAIERYGLQESFPVLGVFGGSLGAGAINSAVADMLDRWEGPAIQVLHLAGRIHAEQIGARAATSPTTWRVVAFEDRMDLFYAASDLVVARAGGAVAELAITATPSILVPGEFGSGAHQVENAEVFADRGASVVLTQNDLAELGDVVRSLITDRERLSTMSRACGSLAKPDAAATIARALKEMHA
jgi:UDP-N-acetylglucosamine--N-acetylmuramyl-(pentapeptide) pyrophosphoryl-undecaprenol N-acetylglucosamine transferase